MKLWRYLSNQRFFPLIIWDGLGVFISFLIALSFRFDGQIPDKYLYYFFVTIPFIILIYCVVNIPFNLYTHIWRYTSSQEVMTITGAVTVSTSLSLLAVTHRNDTHLVPVSVVLLGGLLTAGVFTLVRYRQRILTGLISRLEKVAGSPNRQRVLIVGAGESGQSLARQLQSNHRQRLYELVGFIDDDSRKWGLRVHSAPILGGRQLIPEAVRSRAVKLIVIAIHNISGPVMREILSICLQTQAQVKILPNFLGDIGKLNGNLPLTDVRPEDLLGREPNQIDKTACSALIAGKVVLVTGAAGSIGSELCRQILAWQPRQLLLLDNNETGLHDLMLTLRRHMPAEDDRTLAPIVADVTRRPRLEAVFAAYRPQLVFHAAAYKHVPMMEQHPSEAVLVNIGGTYNLARLAARYQAEQFVLISSDKAVRPSSIMGATKRVCEKIITEIGATAAVASANGNQQVAAYLPAPCRFTAVRFGNVLGSRGSVVPTFTQQIEQGGPVTVTHPEMTRYFMSIAEAVSLVIQAATLTEGGDLFMLDMGQRIQIVELARKMIRLRGLRPEQDIPVIYTGIRPGEKLHEELITEKEQRQSTDHPKIFRIRAYENGNRAENLIEQIVYLLDLAQNQQKQEMESLLWRLIDPAAVRYETQLLV